MTLKSSINLKACINWLRTEDKAYIYKEFIFPIHTVDNMQIIFLFCSQNQSYSLAVNVLSSVIVSLTSIASGLSQNICLRITHFVSCMSSFEVEIRDERTMSSGVYRSLTSPPVYIKQRISEICL